MCTRPERSDRGESYAEAKYLGQGERPIGHGGSASDGRFAVACAPVSVLAYCLIYTATLVIALSIKLPEELAEKSRQVARRLGMTRSELIRQALIHEIEHAQAAMERRALAESLRAMRRGEAVFRRGQGSGGGVRRAPAARKKRLCLR